MGSKNNPGKFDCYAKAEPDEPVFVLLARDPFAPMLVDQWADDVEMAVSTRLLPSSKRDKAAEARICANEMRAWRKDNRPSLDQGPLREVLEKHRTGELDAEQTIAAIMATMKP